MSAGHSDNVQVFVRVRPFIGREADTERVVHVHGDEMVYVDGPDSGFQCNYHHAFGEGASQEQVYRRVRDCVSSVVEGFNSTLFAYGQTGSGKSYTLFGPEGDSSLYEPTVVPSPTAGIIPRAIRDLLAGLSARRQRSTSVFVSFIQIYKERIFDLLRDPVRQAPLSIHEDSTQGIYVRGLSEFLVRSRHDCLQLLRIGDDNRAIRHTHMNEFSSRSHAIFQLTVEQEQDDGTVIRSKLNLVDLAGSEKWNTGIDMERAHVEEMTNINLSLHTLGRCISQLARRRGHVPFRNSQMTRLLQDSLGGNCRTRMIASLSPSSQCVSESVSTLKFADSAKQVMQTVRVNAVRNVDPKYVARLERELAHLRAVVGAVQRKDGAALQQATEKVMAAEAGNGGGGGSSGGENGGVEGFGSGAEGEGPAGGVQHSRRSGAGAPAATEAVAVLEEENAALRRELEQARSRSGSGQQQAVEAAQAMEQLQAALSTAAALWNAVQGMREAAHKFFSLDIEEDELRDRVRSAFAEAKQTMQAAPRSAAHPGGGGVNPPSSVPAVAPAVATGAGRAGSRSRAAAAAEVGPRRPHTPGIGASAPTSRRRRVESRLGSSVGRLGRRGDVHSARGASSRGGRPPPTPVTSGSAGTTPIGAEPGGTPSDGAAGFRLPAVAPDGDRGGKPGRRSGGGGAKLPGQCAPVMLVRERDGQLTTVEKDRNPDAALRQELREARQRKKKLEQLQAWQDEKKRREAEEQAAEEQYQAAVAAEEARRERKCVLLAACAYPHRRSHRDRRQQRDAEVKRALAERRAYRPGT